MDKSTRKNGARRVAPKVTQKSKNPPIPKPKPSKLSSTPSNKIDSEPNSSSELPKRTRGPNVNRLSSAFEDEPQIRTAPSLPLSPKLPVPIVTKSYIKNSKSLLSHDKTGKETNLIIDESPMIYDDIKARFQKNGESNLINSLTKHPINSSSITRIVEESDLNNISDTDLNYEWIEKSEVNDDFSEFSTKKASIEDLFSSKNLILPKDLPLETSKTLPPIPGGTTPPLSPPLSATFSATHSDLSHVETSLPTCSSETTLVEEDELSIEMKRRRRLWNVIKELVETENLFLKDMELLEDVYFIQAQEIPIFEPHVCKTIFNNLPDVIDFSANFLELLKESAGIEDLDNEDADKHLELENDNTTIGEMFAHVMEKHEGRESWIEQVYGGYCKRHEASVQKLQEFDGDENVQGFLQKCKTQCEGKTRSWDIASLLIKPVQRVLKYPLLLQQIYSLTKSTHPDYEYLKTSLLEITEVAGRINEIKRRKDIVEKIVGSKKKSDADLKHAAGFIKATEDELYNAHVEKFKNLEQRGKQLSLEIKEWVKTVKAFFEDQQRFAGAIGDFYTLGSNKNNSEYKKIVEYKNAVGGFASTCGKEQEEAIKKVIYPQIDKYLALFKAPAAPDKTLQQSASAFESISAQLHEELPEFFKLMIQYFNIIIQEFTKIQSRFYHQLGLEFGQYFRKFVNSQKLEEISYDRELIWEKFDVISEYHDQFYIKEKIEDELEALVTIKKSSVTEIKKTEPSVSPKKAEDLVRSDSFDDSSFNFRTIKQKQQKLGVHKKYLTDSELDRRQSSDAEDEIFYDSLTGGGEEEDEDALFYVVATYENKSKYSRELNFKKGDLLKVIHIDDTEQWWFGINEDKEKGWIDPAYVDRLEDEY
ncbi:10765_t:CDS:10 [Diversispora eburnea]|uniref:10765_t:CDS:1 n=1 Tax=Diversispora eburnea TaxID=1213867 RepID=A0A9N9A609_9GLOM|nr:10765_t:CDS:10 [Diversispora eburnea]